MRSAKDDGRRALADRRGVRFVELDALFHGPDWRETPDDELRAIGGRDSLIVYALRMHVARRRTWPAQLAGYPVIRLRSPAEVERWLS
ncbi:MAG TPA: hypothetical protein VFZ00_31805 [Solirubrobacter sp.]|nr:hypothetical protein [Solirubrobacter sp.]